MATFLIQTVVCTTNVILYFAAHKGDGTKRGCGGAGDASTTPGLYEPVDPEVRNHPYITSAKGLGGWGQKNSKIVLT